MSIDLSKKTALVWDTCLYPYAATKLAEEFGSVYYYAPYMSSSSPTYRKLAWGSGLPGVERVKDPFDIIDDCDLIMFPDIGYGDLQAWLRKKGYNVWGSAAAELLEQDRVRLKQLMKAQRMSVPPTWICEGMDALREHLEDAANDDQFVKISEMRSDFETHAHKNPWLSQQWLRDKDHKLGPMRGIPKFVVEASIDGVEVGGDHVCIDGVFLSPTVIGYEAKDTGYLGRVLDYDDVPKVMKDINAKLAPALAKLGCRSTFSTEIRVTKDGEGFMIDPTLRYPSPPSEVMLELFSNWPEVYFHGAARKAVDPQPTARFCAELMLSSDVAESDFLALRFPPEHRRFVKLHGHCIIDGVDYTGSLGMDTIGGAVGIGNTLAAAKEMAIEVAKSVEGEGVTYDESAFDVLEERIAEGNKRGISWT